MKALVVTKPGEALIQDIPEVIPKPDEVILQVRRIGLCGSDLNTFRGRNPLVTFPRILGHEVAATIIQGSHEYPHLLPGMNVTLSPYTACGHCAACLRGRPNACEFNQTLGVQRDGALTEYISIHPRKIYSASLALEELCLVEPLTIGFHAAARGRVQREDCVAVIGCGGVGLGAIAAAAARGAKTLAIDLDDEKLKIAVAAGATDAINSSREPIHERLAEITSGRGPDVIIEAIGLPQTFRMAVEEVAYTGRVVYIGYAKEPVEYETALFVKKELDILGSRNALDADFRAVIRMLEESRFPVADAVSCIIQLDQVSEALRAWSESPASVKKIMVSFD